MDRAPTACPFDEEHKNKNKKRDKEYSITGQRWNWWLRRGSCGLVQRAWILWSCSKSVDYGMSSILHFPFLSIWFPPMMSRSEAPRFWRKGNEKYETPCLWFSFLRRRSASTWLALNSLRSSLVAELGVCSDGLGRTIVGVLGEEERDRGEDVLEEALPNAIRRRCHWVEVVVPATAPFQKP